MSGYAPGDTVGEEPPEPFERLTKPFSLEELADAISRTLREHSNEIDDNGATM